MYHSPTLVNFCERHVKNCNSLKVANDLYENGEDGNAVVPMKPTRAQASEDNESAFDAIACQWVAMSTAC